MDNYSRRYGKILQHVMRKTLVLLSLFLFSCVCKKDSILSLEPAVELTKEESSDMVKLYFWWELEKKEGKLRHKKYDRILEDGFYSININNCVVKNDIIIRSGDTDKKGEIKNGQYYGEWIYIYKNDTLKIENYNSRGLLDGEYVVFGADKEVKYRTVFKNGTGYYKDYCFRLDRIKEEGQYANGKKKGKWHTYDEL